LTTQHWQSYADCWSLDPEVRATQLTEHTTDTVRYRDPTTELAGHHSLANYMQGFSVAYPGHRFVIRDVHDHHGRSLARWTQLDATGTIVMHGASTAVHAEDGRLAEIDGFFLGGPDESTGR